MVTLQNESFENQALDWFGSERFVKRHKSQPRHAGKRGQISVGPELGRCLMAAGESSQSRVETLRLRQKCDPLVSAALVVSLPGRRHRLYVLTYHRFGCQQSQQSELSEAAEQELLVLRLIEPVSRQLRVGVPAPYEREPHICVKEIQ